MNTVHPDTVSFLMIAEDSAADLSLIRMALERYGIAMELHVVKDGEAATRFVEDVEADSRAPCPALAVLDLNLPRISGQQLLRRIRSSDKWRNVPVIVFSSSLSLRDRADALSLGATAYFSKPLDLEQFLGLGALIKDALVTCRHEVR